MANIGIKQLKKTGDLIKFIMVILVQIIFLSPSLRFKFISPFVYPLIYNSFKIGKKTLISNLFKACLLGHMIDFISNEFGLHSFASILYICFQNSIASYIVPKVVYNKGLYLAQISNPIHYFFITILPLLIHSCIYYLLESMEISMIVLNLKKGFYTTIYSYLLIVIYIALPFFFVPRR